jgi:hypothetical protein
MSSKIFCHRPRRKLKPAPSRLVIVDDPIARRKRIEAERREGERIQADRRQRMLERSATRAVHSAPAVPKDQSDLDADWFLTHPGRNHYVRRKGKSEFPAHLDQCWSRWVVVRQLQPGVRLRLPFNIPRDSRALLNRIDNEEGAEAMFDLIASDPKARPLEGEGQTLGARR